MIKRFSVTGVTRDREYDVTKGSDGSRIIYLTANPNGEAETVKIYLKPKKRLRNIKFDFDFGELTIKGRNSMGNILSRHAVDRVVLKEKGISTLGGLDIWFDPAVVRINSDERGKYLGNFSADDKILAITKSGHFNLYGFDLTTHFDHDTIIVEKFNPDKIFSAVFYDGEQQHYYLKRFEVEETAKKTSFINGHPDSKLIAISGKKSPRFEITFAGRHAKRPTEIIDANEFITVKGYKARGKRLTTFTVATVSEIEPLIPEEENGDQAEPQVDQPEAGDNPQRELDFPQDS
jgi:topoisomerase-4 subunit A